MGLAAESDALVLASVAQRRAYAGYAVVEVPSRRDFWYGNALVLEHEPRAADRAAWIARHAEHFPQLAIERRTIVWETAGVRERAPARGDDAAEDIERSIVFVRREPYGTPPDPRVRPFRDDADWDAAVAMNAAEDVESTPAMSAFSRWRFGVTRADAARGRMRMWGRWEGRELAAFAGVYASDGLARFATPVTAERFRGRGFFRTLCATAVDATLESTPNAAIVIVAAAGSDPEIVYRRLGFAAEGEFFGLLGAVAPRAR